GIGSIFLFFLVRTNCEWTHLGCGQRRNRRLDSRRAGNGHRHGERHREKPETDEGGAYLAPNLLPGTYTVRVMFPGFQTWLRENVRLEVGQDVVIDVVLSPGAQAETVTITEEVPLINTTSATLGGTLSNQTINDLPLNGRNFTSLLELRPGIVLNLGNNSGGTGAAAANGLRPEQSNEYLVEGLHGMSPFNGQPVMNSLALRGDAATILPVDAIQEFSTQQNTKAEYGWRAGSTVNVGLKSGTNAFHG